MEIQGSSPKPVNETKPQSQSLEQQLEKLNEQKRKIEEDLRKKSTNPDPEAAKGDDAANSAVNKRILEKLEKKIETLKSRQEQVEKNEPDKASQEKPLSVTPVQEPDKGTEVDIYA